MTSSCRSLPDACDRSLVYAIHVPYSWWCDGCNDGLALHILVHICIPSTQVHTVGELERVLQLKLEGCMLGINNRDLGTFKVDLNNNKLIMDSAPGQQVRL